MTNEDLLELAANAASAEKCMHCGLPTGTYRHPPEKGILRSSTDGWNPLTDDGDALRLAVKLGLTIKHTPTHSIALTDLIPLLFFSEESNVDRCAATRRAIVRAAAEIGRQNV